MKHYLSPIFTLAAFALLATTSVLAENEYKMVIAVKTDKVELTETDISTLAIGESKTIETDDGKVIDILRTVDGAEIYVDGELLEINFDDEVLHEGLHEKHMIRKHVEVICDDQEDCDNHVMIFVDGVDESAHWISEIGELVLMAEDIEFFCSDEEEGSDCSDHVMWIADSDDIDIDIEALHELHMSGEDHQVIVIKKKISHQD